MIAGLAIVWGLSLAGASGGRLRRLENVEVAGWPLVIGAFVVQGIARGRLVGSSASSWGLLVWSVASLTLVVAMTAWTLRRSTSVIRRGGSLIAIGTAVNLFVVLVNGGMPVATQAAGPIGSIEASGGFYAYANAGTSLSWLGDAMQLPIAGRLMLVSVGDILLAVGLVIVLVEATMTPSGHITPPTP